MLRHFSKITHKPLCNKRAVFSAVAILQLKRFESSGVFANSQRNNFRQSGAEKDAGALQDLLRRVMEIDADITKTPVMAFKPNTQICTAYCLNDELLLESIAERLPFNDYYVNNMYDDMLHISNTLFGGDIFLFSNGTLTFWGIDKNNQDKFIEAVRETQLPMESYQTKETMEYAIDEDELTDMKGDIAILNPYTPSIHLSKIAFSYGLGRAAKVTSVEYSINRYLADIASIPSQLCAVDYGKEKLNYQSIAGRLLLIQQRIVKGSQDGLLGTSDFHWAKPELEGYVNKISTKFDVPTRIAIINKQLEYAKNVVNTAKEYHCLT